MRNPDQDAMEMAQRRAKLLETGFRLFAEHSIEAVKLQDIATESKIGIATLYRYFGNKPEMVIEIGTKKWEEYYLEVEKISAERSGKPTTAAEDLDFFLDCFIELYRSHKDLVLFNRNFVTYVKHEKCTREQMKDYNESIARFSKKFHNLYSKGQMDGTLDIRFSEKKMFENLMYIMISVVGKFAEGFIYPIDEERDMTEDLYMLKDLILNAFTKKKE